MAKDQTNNPLPVDWLNDLPDDLRAQLGFLIEADRLKSVLRANQTARGDRYENSAEHSWHLALCALVLAGTADQKIDPARVISMVLLHDLVEIDCGDMPLHDPRATEKHVQEEAKAAERIFGLLPAGQASRLHALWHEFEAAETADARFAKALDRLIPVILIHLNRGDTWADYDVNVAQVRAKSRAIGAASTQLEHVLDSILAEATAGGWLPMSSEGGAQ